MTNLAHFGIVAAALVAAPDDLVWRVENCCGPNCLYALLRSKGVESDYVALQDALLASGQPVSLADLARHTATLGVHLAIGRTDVAGLRLLDMPAIVHFEGVAAQGELTGHYVVVLSADDSGVTYLDGTTAETRSVAWPEFEADWSGYVAFVEPAFQRWSVPLAAASVLVGACVAVVCWRFLPRQGRLLSRALVAGALISSGEAEAAAPPTHTKETLAQAVAEHWNRIDSLVVEFDSRHVSGDGEGLRTTLVVKGVQRMVESSHGELAPEDDPRSWRQIRTRDEWNVFQPHWRVYEVSRRFVEAPYTDKITGHMFFEATGWWPRGDENEPLCLENGKSYFLRDVLGDPAYVIAPALAMIEGAACHVVERAGEDCLWIDAARGVLMRRQFFAENRVDSEVSCELRDYREVAARIWLPYEIERYHRGLAHHVVHRVQSYRVNDVTDAAFVFVPPPGTLIHNRDTDEFSQTPGGLDFFEELISRAYSRVEAPRRPFPWTLVVLPALCGIALGALGAPLTTPRGAIRVK
ncbi:MAG: hypothetical protein KF708_16405 [Pirellulales bacterium]|nr:hypothetical protein [Pirellulales bacterium]